MLKKIGKKKALSKESAKGGNFWRRPYKKLTMKDMPAFKAKLRKIQQTGELFLEYNGRKYSEGYAMLAIRVTEYEDKAGASWRWEDG